MFNKTKIDSVNAFIGKDKITDLVFCLSSWPPATLNVVSEFHFKIFCTDLEHNLLT